MLLRELGGGEGDEWGRSSGGFADAGAAGGVVKAAQALQCESVGFLLLSIAAAADACGQFLPRPHCRLRLVHSCMVLSAWVLLP